MVHLKPRSEEQIDRAIARRGFRVRHLLLFILGSAIAHALIFLLLAKYETSKPVAEKEESKPIEFVVVPPEEESPEPPTETNNRAAENSVAEPNVQPEPTAPNTEIASEPATTPPPPSAPAPKPVPAPSPEVAAQPEPAPEPEPAADDLISGSDASVNAPEPEEKETTATQENVATRLPPEPGPSSSSEGSAADLLGGNYQKTLADGGGEAFFSPEALTHEAVLNPSQLNALRDVDLSAYFAEIKRRVKRNWNPSYSSEEHTTYLTFNIQKNGQITNLQVSKSSGSQKLDRESLEAVQNSAPFDPLPPDFPLEALEIEFSFNIYLY